MKADPPRGRPHVAHAARVAVVATVVIGAMYVLVVAGFDIVDRHRLVGQVDTRLQQRLLQAVRHPATAGSLDAYDNAHDADDAPVFLWRVTSSGVATPLTPGAPALPRSAWSSSDPSQQAQLGNESFGLQAVRAGDAWFVAAQSLAAADHVGSDLVLLEAIAGPLLLVAVFFGTLLIGVKAASPSSRPTRPTSSARR
jgi:hypothetical protein